MWTGSFTSSCCSGGGCTTHEHGSTTTRSPVLPEAIPAETLYELKLNCKVSAAAHIRALLLSTITPLPVTLHSIHGEQNDANEQTHIRAEVTTAGRNNEAVEQVVMRLLFEDDVSTLSWSIIESTME
jgi:putative Mg2+ transporter-C (MgtC) family protein